MAAISTIKTASYRAPSSSADGTSLEPSTINPLIRVRRLSPQHSIQCRLKATGRSMALSINSHGGYPTARIQKESSCSPQAIGAPGQQNLVDFDADGGVTFSGMIPGRADDKLGIGLAYSGISNEAHALNLDSGRPTARTYEALFEICYTAQLNPGWTLQPDFQY